MSSTETPPASVGAATTAAAAAVPPPPQERMISKLAFRMLERNSSMLFALATSSKGSQVSRLSLAANELLREICERKVEKSTMEQLEFYVRSNRLKEESAQPVVFLAQSILAMGRSIAGLEDTVANPPAVRVKPPLNFGGGDDGVENMLAVPSGTWAKKPKRALPLFRKEDPAVDGELDTSDHTETSASSGEKPVSGENDWCVKIGPVLKFRPLTPKGDQREEPPLTPSPPPSPTLGNILKRSRREMRDEEDSDMMEEDDFDDDGTQREDTTASSSVEKDGVQCPMCDTFFYAQHQLDSHLVGYHRMKPTFDDAPAPDFSSSHQPSDSSHHQSGTFGGSAVIGTTKPLNGFGLQQQQQQQRHQGGGTAQVRATEQIRLTAATVTSPGGTIRHYSSPSNAARAAAKAAAAAANGVFRPNLPSKPYTCRQCGVVLQSQQMYASHVRYNHPKEKEGGLGTPMPRHKPQSSGPKETAIVHLQMDDGTKAFKCRRCDKVFDSAQKVAGHSRHCLLVFEGKARPATQGPVPTEDRPYTVYRCGLNSDLARTCPYCGELLPSIRKVDKHVRMVHEAGRHEVYGCSTCDRRFVTLGGIENHWLHYGDCPQGVLTVHKDGVVTCADIGEIPPPLKRPKMVLQAQKKAAEEDEDPSVSIVNAILGAHGFKVPGRDAPALSPEPEESEERMEDGEEEEAAPDLEEYGEGEEDEEQLNGDSHLEEEMDDDEGELRVKGEEEGEDVEDGEGEEEEEGEEVEMKPVVKKEKIIVSMKLMRCRHCDFAARSRDGMDAHMMEHHPDESLADESATSPLDDDEVDDDHLNDEAMNGSSASPQLDDSANEETMQTGEMRRMLGISSD